MPYSGETGNALSQVAAAQSLLVADVLSSYEVIDDDPAYLEQIASACIPLTDLDQPVTTDQITRCLSIDGSRQQDVVRKQQGAGRAVSVGFIRIGGCLTNLEEYRALSMQEFIDPVRELRSRSAAILDYPLPGAALRVRGSTSEHPWRPAANRFLTDGYISDDLFPGGGGDSLAISLADAVLLLHGRPGAPAEKAPIKVCPKCGARDVTGLTYVTRDGGTCPECKAHLYLVDCLGLETAMASETSRENALTVTMNVMERLALIAFLELLRARSFEELASTIVIGDGPMAAFGPLAPLTRPLRRYIETLADEVWRTTGRPLLVAGVEKDGEFVRHGDAIRDLIPRGHVMRMTNDYIAENITGRLHGKPYGAEHLYGRRFYYRRNDGLLLTVTVPAAPGILPWSLDPESEDFASYPTLRPTLELLESLRCVKFEGAILPLVFAHQCAALAMGTGRNVLTRLAQDNLGLAQDSRVARETRRAF